MIEMFHNFEKGIAKHIRLKVEGNLIYQEPGKIFDLISH